MHKLVKLVLTLIVMIVIITASLLIGIAYFNEMWLKCIGLIALIILALIMG